MDSHFAGRSRISRNWLFAPPLNGAPAWAVTAAASETAVIKDDNTRVKIWVDFMEALG